MIKPVRKKDFNVISLGKLQSGDSIIIICDTFKDMESQAQNCRNWKKRNDANGIKVTSDSKSYSVTATKE